MNGRVVGDDRRKVENRAGVLRYRRRSPCIRDAGLANDEPAVRSKGLNRCQVRHLHFG
jgi:hypothetical protein